MWLLGRILPLVIGDLVPEDNEKWLNFLLLMEIVDRLFSPHISEDSVAYLSVLISDHHSTFTLTRVSFRNCILWFIFLDLF